MSEDKSMTWDELRKQMFALFDRYHNLGFPDEYCLAIARDITKPPTAAGYVFMLWKRKQIYKDEAEYQI